MWWPAGLTVLAGVYSMGATLLALRASQLLPRSRYRRYAISAFWATLTLFNVAFTSLQLAHILGASPPTIYVLYVLQTLIGAPSIVILVSIVLRAMLPEWPEAFGTGFFTAVAITSLALVIHGGSTITSSDAWGLHHLPNLEIARILVAIAYVMAPGVLAGLLFVTGLRDSATGATRTRFILFGFSVLIMFIPHAIQYVISIDGFLIFLLPAISGTGALLGWQSYRIQASASSGNG